MPVIVNVFVYSPNVIENGSRDSFQAILNHFGTCTVIGMNGLSYSIGWNVNSKLKCLGYLGIINFR